MHKGMGGNIVANDIINGLGFHHIGLKARDFEKSLQFYKALGMTCIARWENAAGPIAMLDFGDGGRIELFGDGGDEYSENGKWVHLALAVADVSAAYETALAIGAQPHSAPRDLDLKAEPADITIRIAFVKGPDGEVIEFFRQVK